MACRDEQQAQPLGVAGQPLPLYPISMDWQPPFTMLTPLKVWARSCSTGHD